MIQIPNLILLSRSPSKKFEVWKTTNQPQEDSYPETSLFIYRVNGKSHPNQKVLDVLGEDSLWVEWREQKGEKTIAYCGGDDKSAIVICGKQNFTVWESSIFDGAISCLTKPSPDNLFTASISQQLGKPPIIEITEVYTGDIIATFDTDSFEWLPNGNLLVKSVRYETRQSDGVEVSKLNEEEQEATLSLLDDPDICYEDVFKTSLIDVIFNPITHEIESLLYT